MKKPVNPLYVVKNNGKEIETAGNLVEAFLKKLGLDFVYDYFYALFRSLAIKIKSTNLFHHLIELLEDYKAMLEAVDKNLKKYGLA